MAVLNIQPNQSPTIESNARRALKEDDEVTIKQNVNIQEDLDEEREGSRSTWVLGSECIPYPGLPSIFVCCSFVLYSQEDPAARRQYKNSSNPFYEFELVVVVGNQSDSNPIPRKFSLMIPNSCLVARPDFGTLNSKIMSRLTFNAAKANGCIKLQSRQMANGIFLSCFSPI